jgi:uncharacterized protein (TIGR03435 family)
VASVTVFKPGSAPENRRIDAAHGTVNIRQETLREAISWAYGLNNTNSLTGPEWMGIEEFDITGKAPDGTTEEQLRLMLQRLLEERFRLSMHRKPEQKSIFALMVGKDGAKLHEATTGPVKGAHFGVSEGILTVKLVNTVPGFADFLSKIQSSPIVDKTGLGGVYEIELKVELDDPQARVPEAGEVFHGFEISRGLPGAVEALGLRLVKEKGEADALVVDHVERPTGN